jgi:hypothetical protein
VVCQLGLTVQILRGHLGLDFIFLRRVTEVKTSMTQRAQECPISACNLHRRVLEQWQTHPINRRKSEILSMGLAAMDTTLFHLRHRHQQLVHLLTTMTQGFGAESGSWTMSARRKLTTAERQCLFNLEQPLHYLSLVRSHDVWTDHFKVRVTQGLVPQLYRLLVALWMARNQVLGLRLIYVKL